MVLIDNTSSSYLIWFYSNTPYYIRHIFSVRAPTRKSRYNLVKSRSRITTDGQSVIMSRYRAHSGTFDQILLSVRRFFFLKFAVLSFLGRPLWRVVGSVICLSLFSNLPLFTWNIYATCVLQFSNLHAINIKLLSVPSEYSRLCSASYFSLNNNFTYHHRYIVLGRPYGQTLFTQPYLHNGLF
jgi:hypothetical protein